MAKMSLVEIYLPQPVFVFSIQCVAQLHSVLDYEFYFILRTTPTTSVFLHRFGTLLFCWAWG